MKLQLQNVGEATIVVKDLEGYTGFVAEVAKGETNTYDVTRDLVQRLAPRLVEMETLVKDTADPDLVLVGLRWSVLASTTLDDRSMDEGLAGLPSLNEYQAANYSTGGGGSDVVATGTGLLGNQTQATLAVQDAAAAMQLDLTAVNPGAPGNAISLEVITPASTLLVTVAANKITVRPASGGSTILAIANAINAEANAKLLVQAAEGTAGTLNEAVAEQWLDGGVGQGVSLTLNGTAAVLTSVSDTSLTFDLPSGVSANGRIVPLEYRNGPHVSRLSVPVAV
jgi:hypothetical protein